MLATTTDIEEIVSIRSKQIQETQTAYIAGTYYTRQSSNNSPEILVAISLQEIFFMMRSQWACAIQCMDVTVCVV